jgi:hypothetical protein
MTDFTDNPLKAMRMPATFFQIIGNSLEKRLAVIEQRPRTFPSLLAKVEYLRKEERELAKIVEDAEILKGELMKEYVYLTSKGEAKQIALQLEAQ